MINYQVPDYRVEQVKQQNAKKSAPHLFQQFEYLDASYTILGYTRDWEYGALKCDKTEAGQFIHGSVSKTGRDSFSQNYLWAQSEDGYVTRFTITPILLAELNSKNSK